MTKKQDEKDIENQEQDVPVENSNEGIELNQDNSAENEITPLKVAEEMINDLRDKLLRAVAETENVRRRSEKERTDAANYAVTAFARDMLAIGDNLSRAVECIPDTDIPEDIKNTIEGVEMTERELLNIFERHGIKKIDPKGEKFDHNYHQAMFETENTGEESGTIIQVLQVGYKIKDRLLRPAMVGVAKGDTHEKHESVDTIA